MATSQLPLPPAVWTHEDSADSVPRPETKGNDTAWRAFALLVLAATVTLYYIQVYEFAVDFPFHDELEVVIGHMSAPFDVRMHPDALFSLFNDYRFTTFRLALEVMYLIEGTIRFDHLIYLGNLVLLGILFVFAKVLRRSALEWWHLAPIALLLFTVKSYENMMWGIAAFPNYSVLFLSLFALYLFRVERLRYTCAALGLAVLASYTFASGLVVFPVMLVWGVYETATKPTEPRLSLLGMNVPRFHFFRVLAVLGVAALVYWHYFFDYVPHLESRITPTTFSFFVAFFGSLAETLRGAWLLGSIGLVAFAYLTFVGYHRTNPVVYSWLLYCLALGTLAARGRAYSLGVDVALSSRYVIIAAVYFASLYVAFTEATPWPRTLGKRWVIGAILIFGALSLWTLPTSRAYARDRKEFIELHRASWAHFGEGEVYFPLPSPDVGRNYLKRGIERGIYAPRSRKPLTFLSHSMGEPPLAVLSGVYEGGVRPTTESSTRALLVHAPGRVRYKLEPGRHTISGKFGICRQAYASGTTDGVLFQLVGIDAGGARRTIWQRELTPCERPEDRGVQSFACVFDTPGRCTIELITTNAPGKTNAWDLSYWSSLVIVPEQR